MRLALLTAAAALAAATLQPEDALLDTDALQALTVLWVTTPEEKS